MINGLVIHNLILKTYLAIGCSNPSQGEMNLDLVRLKFLLYVVIQQLDSAYPLSHLKCMSFSVVHMLIDWLLESSSWPSLLGDHSITHVRLWLTYLYGGGSKLHTPSSDVQAFSKPFPLEAAEIAKWLYMYVINHNIIWLQYYSHLTISFDCIVSRPPSFTT